MFFSRKKKFFGDLTHMEVICLHKHAQRFRTMGFSDAEIPPTHPIKAWLIDGQAKYSQVYELPTDVPYTAHHRKFGLIGPHLIACDGQRYVAVPGDTDGFVLPWNEESNEPDAEAMAKIREYVEVKKAAEALMQGIIK